MSNVHFLINRDSAGLITSFTITSISPDEETNDDIANIAESFRTGEGQISIVDSHVVLTYPEGELTFRVSDDQDIIQCLQDIDCGKIKPSLELKKRWVTSLYFLLNRVQE